ncbi:MAG: hypothetical protein QOD30_804 [Actinomycetota bacterium]|nr:hypothetical protein [Actinomycetota bacterium]
MSAARVRRTRMILLIELAVALVLGVFLHPLLFAFLLLPVAELAVKPAAQRKQILGLRA